MRKLEITNNWESYEYKVDGANINPSTIDWVYDSGGTPYYVTTASESASYSDHGHRSQVTRTILTIDHPLGRMTIKPGAEIYAGDA